MYALCPMPVPRGLKLALCYPPHLQCWARVVRQALLLHPAPLCRRCRCFAALAGSPISCWAMHRSYLGLCGFSACSAAGRRGRRRRRSATPAALTRGNSLWMPRAYERMPACKATRAPANRVGGGGSGGTAWAARWRRRAAPSAQLAAPIGAFAAAAAALSGQKRAILRLVIIARRLGLLQDSQPAATAIPSS